MNNIVVDEAQKIMVEKVYIKRKKFIASQKHRL